MPWELFLKKVGQGIVVILCVGVAFLIGAAWNHESRMVGEETNTAIDDQREMQDNHRIEKLEMVVDALPSQYPPKHTEMQINNLEDDLTSLVQVTDRLEAGQMEQHVVLIEQRAVLDNILTEVKKN